MNQNETSNWDEIPQGICLIRMLHERTRKHCLHLHTKANAGPWFDQPHIPAALSQKATENSHRDFWKWAEETLPIYNHPEPIKSA